MTDHILGFIVFLVIIAVVFGLPLWVATDRATRAERRKTERARRRRAVFDDDGRAVARGKDGTK